MKRYIDGYVLPIQKNKLKDYKKMAKIGAKIWMKNGALEYVESVGDDFKTFMGLLSFPKGIRAKKGETVIFSFVVFKSKAHRNSVNKKVMNDPTMNDPTNKNIPMPFDTKRVMYSGFSTMVVVKK